MKKKPKKWKGLSDKVLELLEQHLCVIRNRRQLFGGADSTIVPKIPASMIGLLVGAAYKFVVEQVGRSNVIEMQEIANEVLKGGKKKTDFSKFMNGKQNGDRWIGIGRSALAFLLSGETDAKSAGVSAMVKRIDQYFFRGASQPRYFVRERAGSAHAWSYPELAGEIHWLARAALMGASNDGVWYISGGTRFFEGDENDVRAMTESLRSCAEAGVSVNFVYPEGAGDAANSLAALTQLPKDRPVNLHAIANSTGASVASFVTPVTRYLYLGTNELSNLWILRNQHGDEDHHIERGPRAYCGLRDEIVAFDHWLQRFRNGLVAPPVSQIPSALPGERSEQSGA